MQHVLMFAAALVVAGATPFARAEDGSHAGVAPTTRVQTAVTSEAGTIRVDVRTGETSAVPDRAPPAIASGACSSDVLAYDNFLPDGTSSVAVFEGLPDPDSVVGDRVSTTSTGTLSVVGITLYNFNTEPLTAVTIRFSFYDASPSSWTSFPTGYPDTQFGTFDTSFSLNLLQGDALRVGIGAPVPIELTSQDILVTHQILSYTGGDDVVANVGYFRNQSPPPPVGTSELCCFFIDNGEFPGGSYQTFTSLVGPAGNVGYQVVVEDSESPVIACPDAPITRSADPGQCSALVSLDVTATDNVCGPVTPTCVVTGSGTPVDPAADTFAVDTTSVTCTAVDGAGNTATCTFDVTVTDDEAPAITCPPDPTFECNGVMISLDATATDNCDPNPTIGSTQVFMPGPCEGQGTTLRTWTATDAAGNSSSCVQTITFVDSIAPTVTAPADVTVECTASTSPDATGTATAFDQCNGPLDALPSDDTTGLGPCGTGVIVRTWSATDACGNPGTATQLLTVTDTAPPTIDCPDDVTVECTDDTSPVGTGSATATDTCGPAPVVTFQDGGDALGTGCGFPRTIERTWTAADCAGNTTLCAQMITIIDTTPPDLACPDDITVECGDSTDPAATGLATADDACSGTTTAFTDAVTPGDCSAEMTITRTWIATDDCGNATTCIQTIEVLDTLAPALTLPADVTVECNAATSPDATGTAAAVDHCDETPEVASNDDTSGLDACGTGVIVRTWTATDDCGNPAMADQLITVTDTNPPTITCPTDVTIECTDDSSPAATGSATATDTCGPEPAVTFRDGGGATGFGCGFPQTIAHTWTATDCSGNSTPCVQMITIIDTTPPDLTCPADVTIDCSDSTAPAATGSATAGDACSGASVTSADVMATGACPGESTITRTWTATDDCGNATTCDQVITITDTAPPTVTGCPAMVEVPYPDPGTETTPVTWDPPTVADDCSEPVSLLYEIAIDSVGPAAVLTSDPAADLPPGLHTVTVIATDACGNADQACTFTILVGLVPRDCNGIPLPACYVSEQCLDCNGNGYCDLEELAIDPRADANGNSVIDTCETTCCDRRSEELRVLVMRYVGDDCTVAPPPPAEIACADTSLLLDSVFVLATDNEDPFEPAAEVWFEGPVTRDELFHVSALNAGEPRLGSVTYVHVFDLVPTLFAAPLQTVTIDTDCAAPITRGERFGASVLVECYTTEDPLPCECCFGTGGRPAILTMQYTADDCTMTGNLQDPALSACDDFESLRDDVFIRVTPFEDPMEIGSPTWFAGRVVAGELFTIDAIAAGFAYLTPTTFIHVFDTEPTLGAELLQTIRIATACDEPLFEDDRFGSARLLGCIREEDVAAARLLNGGDCNGNGVEDGVETAIAPGTDGNADCLPDDCVAPDCPGDTNGDGMVDIDDIVNVVLDFDTDGSANGGDLDGSGVVDVDDIVFAVLNFGACPGAGT